MSHFNVRGDVPEVIPPIHEARTLVLCFDGTGDQFDNNSNVVLLFSALKKDDRTKQMVYYQTGIGTYNPPSIATPIAGHIAKIADQAVAWYLDAHVTEGYKFIMQNYTQGDKICLFGFSRGAYTARALAGMLHKVGLLPPHNEQQVPFAYKMFTRTDDEGWSQSKGFKKAFCIDVTIEFVGVWDTVCSVGLIPKRLPFTTSNYAIRYFRHALALDEHRAKFMPNCWNRPTSEEEALGAQPKKHKKVQSHEGGMSGKKGKDDWHYEDVRLKPTDVEEVWFAGCHCDVGGGAVANDTPAALSRVPLRWMIKQTFLAHTGIMYDSDALAGLGINPDALWPGVLPTPLTTPMSSTFVGTSVSDMLSVDPTKGGTPFSPTSVSPMNAAPSFAMAVPKTPTDAVAPPATTSALTTTSTATAVSALTTPEIDIADILSPMFDQLVMAPFWWILELLPMKHRYQDKTNKWHKFWSWNFGRPRHIPRQSEGFKVHVSVKKRMEEEGYVPRAEFQREPTWVE